MTDGFVAGEDLGEVGERINKELASLWDALILGWDTRDVPRSELPEEVAKAKFIREYVALCKKHGCYIRPWSWDDDTCYVNSKSKEDKYWGEDFVEHVKGLRGE